ncbi:MAG: hypothetical protein AGIKBDMD_00828 [Synergistaceae bacterium]
MLKRRLLKLLLILIMMLLPLHGMPASANTGSPGKIKTATPGTTVTESVYLVPLQDGRDTLELIDTQSAEITALRGIVASKDIQIDKLISAVEDLNRNRLQERIEWQEQLGTLVNKNIVLDKKLAIEKSKLWGIGIFGGFAHTGESVIGIGITYDITKF